MAQDGKEGRGTVWEQRWRERIAGWRASGQTQQEYCRSHGISVSSFSHWKSKLARRESGGEQTPPAQGVASGRPVLEPLGWAELGWRPAAAAAAQGPADGGGFEIVLPQGWRVRLGPEFEAEPLRRLLSVLAESSC